VYCGQCGTQNNEEAGSCETCGAPLLITAGSRSCASCGGSLGDHDRFCPTCGAAADDEPEAESFDATDAFEEIDINEIDISELPPWLQEMAENEEQNGRPASPGQPSPEDLPDWLRESESDGSSDTSPSTNPTQPTASAGVQHQPAELFSLVSDEDLPDWLKALGEEESESPRPASPATNHESSPSTAVALVFEVPPISRAWLTQGRQVDPSSVASAQQQFSPLDPLTGAAEHSEEAGTWESTDGFAEESVDTTPTRTESAPTQRAGGRNIARIVMFALLLVIILTVAYVIIQGT
jgi:hypothetical protein